MRTLLLSILLGSVALCASSVNCSGKWALQVPFRGGQMRTVIFVLNQVGDEVTGNILNPPRGGAGVPGNTEILDGKVDGNNISFYVWTGVDVPRKATYKGIMSGDQIKFTVTGGAMGPSAGQARDRDPQELLAKRTK